MRTKLLHAFVEQAQRRICGAGSESKVLLFTLLSSKAGVARQIAIEKNEEKYVQEKSVLEG